MMTTPRMYRNPIWPRGFADPFVLKVRGRYYAYATEEMESPAEGESAFPVLRSDDLVHWRSVGRALAALGLPYFRYWAPEVTEDNGRFLMYYAVHTAPFVAAIRVAVAERPEGPFQDSGHDLTSSSFAWAIDPHVFRDDDGAWYLYMTVEYQDDPTGLIGSGNVVDRLCNPFTLEGRPARVTRPRHAWQLFEARRAEKGGVDWYCVEGPALTRHRDHYYEMFSGGCYYRDNYAIAYATSWTPMGAGGMRNASWQDWERQDGDGRLVRTVPGRVIGPGHNSLVLGPNNADLYMAYHAWPPEMTARLLYIDRLFWHGDALWTEAPTYTPRPAPLLPRVHEFFEGEDTALPPGWSTRGGRWRHDSDAVMQQDSAEPRAALFHRERLGQTWLLEAHVRHVEDSGRYGLLLCDESGGEWRLAIDPLTQRIAWSSGSSGAPERSIALPAGFTAAAWHQLLLRYSGALLAIHLDGLPVLEVVVERLCDSFALLTERCGAAFAAISLSDHFRDEFLDEQRPLMVLGWRGMHGDMAHWCVRARALEQSDASRGAHVLLKQSSAGNCEYGATLRLLRASKGGQPALGLALRRDAGDMLALRLVCEQARWQVLFGDVRAGPGASVACVLPASFDATGWHTLRLVHRGATITLFLDGPELRTLTAPEDIGAFGVATWDCAARFTGVWQTGWPAEAASESADGDSSLV